MSMNKHGPCWFVVQTHARAEDKATLNLRRQGFEVYAPKIMKRRSHARKVEMINAPLFPRYLFVKIDTASTGWSAIRSTFGVSSLVCFGDAPAPVPEGLVETLMGNEDENGCIQLGRRSEFKKGQGIEIIDGPMAEMVAVFDHMDDKDRVVVLLDLMGRQVRARVPLRVIRSVA